MKAVICPKYGGPEVLQLTILDKPVAKNDEVLIGIKATAVNSADWRLRKADPYAVRLFFGLTKPKRPVLGGVFAGVVAAVGKDVKLFKIGDRVFGCTGMSFGAYAEYKCVPEDGILSLMPNEASFEQAAAIPFGGAAALFFLRKANIKAGQKVLIIGASGAVGTAAIQIAKYFGADVTGVCSASNVALVKSLGADKVLDYATTDYADRHESYDVVFETVGKTPFSNCSSLLRKNGILILGAAGLSETLRGLWTTISSSRKVITTVISPKAEEIMFLKELMEQGKLKAVVDRKYALEQIVEAHAYVEQGHKKGNVVIAVSAA